MKKNVRRSGKRGVSFGTICSLALTIVVCAGLFLVFGKLGGEMNLAQVISAIHAESADENGRPVPVTTQAQTSSQPAATQTLSPAAPSGGSFTLTAGGTICIDSPVRKSGYSDVKTYDFSDIFTLVGDDIKSDIALASLENLTDPALKVSDLVAPVEAMSMMRSAGFNTVALGFGKAMDKGTAPLLNTVSAAQNQRLQVIGAGTEQMTIRQLNGVSVALLHYTDSVSSAGKKNLKKDGRSWLLPSSETAAADIAAARNQGAQVVIVSIHWGSSGKSSVNNAQRTTAQMLADAGADVILGTGTRTVQPAAWIHAADGRSVFCLYSLGTLISEDRSNSQVAGMLLHLNLDVDASGKLTFQQIACTPTYIWRYKFGSTYRYRVVDCTNAAPDGMEDAQITSMKRALETVQKALGTEVAFTY